MSAGKSPGGGLRRKGRDLVDPDQIEFGIVCQPLSSPFRLWAGDVIRFNGRLCYVVRVNECSAVVLMNRPVRDFKTRFDRPVRFQPPPLQFYISANSEVPILNRRAR